MELHELLSYIEQYGYWALFFCLWLGIIGMPIPDEMIVMSGGFVSSLGILSVIPAFLLTYLGVVSGLSLGYILGKIFGTKVLDKLMKKKKAKYLLKSQQIVEKYGHYALVISYFIPVVRHIVPYLVGMNNMSFKTYAIYSYVIGFVWTLVYFVLGSIFGKHIEMIATLVTEYGIYFGGIVIIVSIISYVYMHKKNTVVSEIK
ncbi:MULTISPECIES: DedA family protein [Bacillus]|uniref:DedA family protein n=1 Tax=Bacillus TaxID=1386 RepID=UPI0003308045|nr:alkaline phosphatase [Bacillus cereus BAG2O-3]EOQ08081.1 alkaline phosphatase [Bacillus cereus B5-2]EOQ24282.1 alkaline phosphatase [Bacillus cereus BAG3O-1]MBJ8119273.1 DedA family protein [Bacillus cereus]PFW84588.1 DedA family protein [Bacillus sp. AFS075960]RFB09028.1 DedA family protein [Bacillus sp. OE]RFB20040.1 DedA family protein [Bacillus sp. LB(2018)]RFB50873.1 DedA family protein [Bacillus sp. dmp10]RFB77854.1 DedA family protein [Bacillus sp. AW]